MKTSRDLGPVQGLAVEVTELNRPGGQALPDEAEPFIGPVYMPGPFSRTDPVYTGRNAGIPRFGGSA